MATLLRAEPLSTGPVRWAGSSGRQITFVRVFYWMQLLMVVMNLGRIPVLSTDERDFPLQFNELCLAGMLIAALFAIKSWRTIRIDSISIVALTFAFIGGASALWSVQRFDLTPFELFVSLSF